MGSIKTTINQTMSIDGEDTGYFGVSKTKKGIKLPDKTFTYGRPNHCIDGGAQEAMQYLVLQEKREIQKAQERQKMKKKKIYETQAKLIRNINDKALLKEEQRSNPKQPWQMSKFKSVKSTLNTFRSEGLKKQSFKQHEDNRCIRLGQTGHGNYK